MVKIKNYTELQEALGSNDYALMKPVLCRSALRSLVVCKRFLDNWDIDRNGEYALAMFRDICLAINHICSPDNSLSERPSYSRAFMSGDLKTLCECDEGFAFGYGSAFLCLNGVYRTEFEPRNSVVWASKNLEISGSFSDRETLFRTLWLPVEIDVSTARKEPNPRAVFTSHELTPGGGLSGQPRYQPYDLLLALKHAGKDWSFWRDWYQGFLDGTPLDWELQRRVALIPDEVWTQGPAHIAEKIEEIRRDFDAEQSTKANLAKDEVPIPPAMAQAMARRMATNRDAIVLSSAGLLEQIAEFRETIRGNNQLDPEFKERLLGFLDDLSSKLTDLIDLLPTDVTAIDDEIGEKGVRWLQGFKLALLENAWEYCEPKNIAGAAIPTGIILACTGVGSLMGMPVAGTVVGGLLTGQLKPGKAANDLLKPTKPEVDP